MSGKSVQPGHDDPPRNVYALDPLSRDASLRERYALLGKFSSEERAYFARYLSRRGNFDIKTARKCAREVHEQIQSRNGSRCDVEDVARALIQTRQLQAAQPSTTSVTAAQVGTVLPSERPTQRPTTTAYNPRSEGSGRSRGSASRPAADGVDGAMTAFSQTSLADRAGYSADPASGIRLDDPGFRHGATLVPNSRQIVVTPGVTRNTLSSPRNLPIRTSSLEHLRAASATLVRASQQASARERIDAPTGTSVWAILLAADSADTLLSALGQFRALYEQSGPSVNLTGYQAEALARDSRLRGIYVERLRDRVRTTLQSRRSGGDEESRDNSQDEDDDDYNEDDDHDGTDDGRDDPDEQDEQRRQLRQRLHANEPVDPVYHRSLSNVTGRTMSSQIAQYSTSRSARREDRLDQGFPPGRRR